MVKTRGIHSPMLMTVQEIVDALMEDALKEANLKLKKNEKKIAKLERTIEELEIDCCNQEAELALAWEVVDDLRSRLEKASNRGFQDSPTLTQQAREINRLNQVVLEQEAEIEALKVLKDENDALKKKLDFHAELVKKLTAKLYETPEASLADVVRCIYPEPALTFIREMQKAALLLGFDLRREKENK